VALIGLCAQRRQAFAEFCNGRRWRDVAAYLGVVLLGLGLTLGDTRAHQAHALQGLFQRHRTATVVPATITSIDETDKGVRIIRATPGAKTTDSDIRLRYDSQYLALRFEGSGSLPTWIAPKDPDNNVIYPQELVGGSATGPATIYFPMSQWPGKFEIAFQGGDPNAKITLSSIANPDEFPVVTLHRKTNI
jgi:hypothetical protein